MQNNKESVKLKVCFLIPTVNAGGIETYLLRFLKHINTAFDVTIIVRSIQKGELYDEYMKLGATIVFKPLGYFNVQRIMDYYRLFKSQNFNVVCDFNANFAGLPMWIAKEAGVKNRIAFYRQGRDHFKSSKFKRCYNKWANNLVYKHATSILSNSQSAIEYFFPYRQKVDNRFKVIRNGVDSAIFGEIVDVSLLRAELDIPEKGFVVGHSGRLDKAKNHETIMKVAKEIVDQDPNVFFVFCGKETQLLQKKVDELQLSANVRLLGYRSDVSKILKIIDMFYFPSITEGQPNALIEAMLSGLPFVASNIEPIRETVPVKLHEWLVEPLEVKSVVVLMLKFKHDMQLAKNRLNDCETELIDKYSASKNFDDFYQIIIKR